MAEKINRYAAVVAAAVVCPIVNSGLFFIGSALFFIPLIESTLSGPGEGIKFVILTMIGGNFLFEMLFNIVLSPVIFRIINLGEKDGGHAGMQRA